MVLRSIKPGDRVFVTDPALAAMRDIMFRATGSAPPNHHGTVDEIFDDGTILINFDSEDGEGVGNAAPYPPDEVRLLGSDKDGYS
jgi:hypothetical protein